MTTSEIGLHEKLVNIARAKGICSDGYKEMLQSADIGKMIDYYVANPDWCLERDFPSLTLLKENFSEIEDRGVFVCRTFHGELLNNLTTYVFHHCTGTIKVGLNIDKAVIPMLYLANGCRLRVVGVGEIVPKTPSVVPVYTFGKNDLSAKDNKYVKFLRYKSELI